MRSRRSIVLARTSIKSNAHFKSSTRTTCITWFFFFSSRRRHTRLQGDWSSDVCSSDLWMLAAKAGAAHKLGYIAAHSAIVLICLGGLFDGDLIVRAQMWLGGKTPYTGEIGKAACRGRV